LKYIEQYRDANKVLEYSQRINDVTTQPWTIMEICGGQTHAILRFGIDQLIPSDVTLVHGPGCPVCVTDIALIDKALDIASLPEIIFCSFGDMLRVPGSEQDLMSVKADGADMRITYSPLDAVRIAGENPDREVVFFAVGFETTAPATAAAVLIAEKNSISNFTILTAHVLVVPAMEAILSSPENQVQGFLAAGHVSTIIGCSIYEKLTQKFKIPIIVTGFEPLDLIQGIYLCLFQLEQGRNEVENQYNRAVRPEGNTKALELIDTVYETCDRNWRGIGVISASGLQLRHRYSKFDAEKRFKPRINNTRKHRDCISGMILQGIKKPFECPAFGTECNPGHPLGATMVSSEGACAAYYRYHKNR
jgi:hydrogenase expression/formation protein HypD